MSGCPVHACKWDLPLPRWCTPQPATKRDTMRYKLDELKPGRRDNRVAGRKQKRNGNG